MPDEGQYRVSWSPIAMDALREIAQARRGPGRGSELAQTLRALDERLRREPLTVGEVYRSRGVVEEHLAVYQFLAIDFAVDTARGLVMVRDCHSLSGPQE